ncbi:hypothetical protein AOQ84DRAFT_437639 [Glonium stellatum]|uniref:Uncharacterized protein n=1 Tax=Glonium stellatum TaxID=574774 RepID=A0A8E2F6W8_9PEZI|nr:hypothetical protein AOQ84DRAFT_437639 [Glonium stellatum]
MSPHAVGQSTPLSPSPVALKASRSRADSSTSVPSSFLPVPYNTPATRSLAGDIQESPVNLQAVTQTLDAVQETHNEAADDENPPRVPENTPCHGTPNSHLRATFHNLPSIDEKLGNLPPPMTSPISCTSRSPRSSIAGEQGEHAGLISVALGSPRDFFTTNLSDKATLGSLLAASRPDTITPAHAPLTVENLAKNLDGVREHSDWHENIEGDLDRDLVRLENLANDDFQRDPSITTADYYHRRLLNLLSNSSRKYIITELGEAVVSNMAERGSPVEAKSKIVIDYEFQILKRKVDDMEAVLSALTTVLAKASDKELINLHKKTAELTKGDTENT